MEPPLLLHIYQCSFCAVIATSTVKTSYPPIRCNACRRIMAFKWTQAIRTQAERDIASAGVMYNPFMPRAAIKRTCDTCHCFLFEDELLIVEGLGKFCSQRCADVESEKHAAGLERVAILRKEQPWMP